MRPINQRMGEKFDEAYQQRAESLLAVDEQIAAVIEVLGGRRG